MKICGVYLEWKSTESAGFNFLFSYALTFEALYLPGGINQSLFQIFTSAFKSIFCTEPERIEESFALDVKQKGCECVFALNPSCDNLARQNKQNLLPFSLCTQSEISVRMQPRVSKRTSPHFSFIRPFFCARSISAVPIAPYCSRVTALTQIPCRL